MSEERIDEAIAALRTDLEKLRKSMEERQALLESLARIVRKFKVDSGYGYDTDKLY